MNEPGADASAAPLLVPGLAPATAACSVQAPARGLVLPNLLLLRKSSGSRVCVRTTKKDHTVVAFFVVEQIVSDWNLISMELLRWKCLLAGVNLYAIT